MDPYCEIILNGTLYFKESCIQEPQFLGSIRLYELGFLLAAIFFIYGMMYLSDKHEKEARRNDLENKVKQIPTGSG